MDTVELRLRAIRVAPNAPQTPANAGPQGRYLTPKPRGDPIFHGAADFDLELIDSRTLDGHIQELLYRPTLHV